jgi:hypothetical protein
MEVLRKTTVNLTPDCWCVGKNSNWAPHEYKLEAFPHDPTFSDTRVNKDYMYSYGVV